MARAIVTGASSGLGRELVVLLAARGDDVLAVARRVDELNELAASSPNITSLAVDLSTSDGRDAVKAAWPDTDILINNAGFGSHGAFVETPLAVSNEMIQLNVAALTDLTGRYLDAMVGRRSGRVMNVASTAAFLPGPKMAVYYASKAFVLSFTEAIAHELRGTGVTATAFCPGAFASGFQRRADLESIRLVKGRTLPTAAEIAADGLASMDAGKVVRVPGILNQLSAQSIRVSPRFAARHVASWVDS